MSINYTLPKILVRPGTSFCGSEINLGGNSFGDTILAGAPMHCTACTPHMAATDPSGML